MGFFRNLIHLDAAGNQDYYFDMSFGDYLPIGTVELEYLQSTGTQYIDTDIISDTKDIKVEIKYQYLNNTSTGYDSIMGSHETSAGTTRFYVASLSGTSTDRMIMGNGIINIPYDRAVHTIIFNDENHDCYLDGTLVGNVGTTFTGNTRTIHMFGVNHGGSSNYRSASRIWYCKIWKGGELVSHLKPCINSDGTYCFYDMVRKRRFYNAGTGEFIPMYKPNFGDLPIGYKALDYIVATGAQYINTNYALWSNQNWAVETKIALSKFKKYNQLLGLHSTINTTYQTRVDNTGSYYYNFNGNTNSALTALSKDTIHTIKHDNTSSVLMHYVDGTYSQSTSRASTSQTDTVSFGHRKGSPYLEGKIYGLNMWSGNRQVRALIPCMNEQNVVGLYDRISGNFYSSIGDLPFYETEPDLTIPSTYQEVDYITSTGTQYINTGFYPTGDTRYDISFSNCKTNGVLFGAYNNTWTDGFGFYTNVGTGKNYWIHYNTNTDTAIKSTAAADIILDRGIALINGETFTVNTNVLNTNVMYPLYLLAGNMDGTVEQPVICNLKHFKIYTSTGLVRDFVPVVKKGSREVGLFDRVTQEFYGNAGTGAFTAPAIENDNVVLPTGYKRLESIEATGTQYIDTGIKENTAYGLEAHMEVTGSAILWQSLISGTLDNFTLGSTNNASGSNTPSLDGLYIRLRTAEVLLKRQNAIIPEQSNKIIIGGGEVFINDEKVTTYTNGALSTGSNNLFVFTNSAKSRYGYMKLYKLHIYDNNGNALRSFYPCINPDGEIGLFDTIEEKFYPNEGTGLFNYTEMPSKLPTGYTLLEYIQSTGTQYINTGIAPNTQDFKLELKYQYLNELNTGSDAIAGARLGGEGTRFYVCRNLNTTTVDRLVYGNTTKTYTHDTKEHILLMNDENHDSYIDGVFFANLGTNFTPHANPFYLFAMNYENEGAKFKSSGRIWYCKIWKNDELVRDMVPCLNDNAEPGLYDYVEGIFYPNAGTGTFRYCYPVERFDLPKTYYALDYIIANRAQYIDTGVAAWETQNWALKFKVAFTQHYNYNNIFGYGAMENTTHETWAASEGSYYIRLGGNIGKTSIFYPTANTPYEILHDNTGDKLLNTVDGIQKSALTRANAAGYTYPIWFGHRMNGDYLTGKIYGLTIWKDDRMVRDMIPCANEAQVPGLFDRITQTFYPSSSNTPFLTDYIFNPEPEPEPEPDIPEDAPVVEDVSNFMYTGNVQAAELEPGTYRLEAWGASGGDGTDGGPNPAYGGRGGYSVGTLTVTEPTIAYIQVGGQGTRCRGNTVEGGGYNGGGNGNTGNYTYNSTYNGAGGGGASDVRLIQNSLYSRVIVAGGGGGGTNGGSTTNQRYGGAGGGLNGQGTVLNGSYSGSCVLSTGASQTAAGVSGYFGTGANYYGTFAAATFGIGSSATSGDYSAGGGGGGWYGGAATAWGPGSGGSGYIYTASTATSYPTGCLLNTNYYLVDADTVQGTASIIEPDGTTDIGHSGDGYVRITKLT